MVTVFDQIIAMQDKVDSPERLAMFQAYGIVQYADAAFFNLIKAGMLELYELFQLSGGRRLSKTVADAAYTVVADDYNKLLLFTSNTAVTVTVPPGLSLNVFAIQEGNGQVSFVAGQGVAVSPPIDSYAKTETKGAVAGLLLTEPNRFRAIGKLQLI